MKATIMIPAYNAAEFLPETLESAFGQTHNGDYEVLVVNDGSTDDTQAILDSYSRDQSNLRTLSQRNAGIGATRTRLLNESRGEVLLGLDSDDVLFPSALEKAVGFFDTNPNIGFLYTDQQEIDSTGNVVGVRKRKNCHVLFKDLIYHCHFPGHLRAFRMESLGGVCFDPKLRTAEDWDFLLKILPQTGVEHLPEILYSYRINEKGISIGTGDETVGVSVNLLTRVLTEKRIYGERDFEVVPVDAGKHIIYYDHIVEGESTMKPETRRVLERYLQNGE